MTPLLVPPQVLVVDNRKVAAVAAVKIVVAVAGMRKVVAGR